MNKSEILRNKIRAELTNTSTPKYRYIKAWWLPLLLSTTLLNTLVSASILISLLE